MQAATPGEAVSARAFAADTRRWHSEDGDVVAYVDTGSAWVAMGSPLAPSGRRAAVARAFCEQAREHHRRVCFFGVEDETWSSGLRRLEVGEQPHFTASSWRTSLKTHRSLREQLRRARAKGVVVRAATEAELAPGTPLRSAVEKLASEWLDTRRMEPLRFVVDLDPFRRPASHRYFTAHVGEDLVAFASVAPTADERTLLAEDILRAKAAPNGTTESLLDVICGSLAENESLTLGLAPLSGSARWQRVVRLVTRPLYDFSGLARFKARLHPRAWQPVWIVAGQDTRVMPALADCLRAFAGGPLWRFALRTILRRPGGFPYAFAVPLIPWTAVLYALALFHRTGPLGFSGAALWGWSLYDTVLVAGMFAAAYRPRLRLLLLLTCAATLDAMVSVTHVVHAGLGPDLLSVLLRLAATAAPVFATFALAWSAHLVRSKVGAPG